MTRLALVALVACGVKDPDPIAGTYQLETGKGPRVELRADGTLDMPPDVDLRCDEDAAAIAACRTTQRWTRAGETITLRRGVVRLSPSHQDSFGDRRGPRCICDHEDHTGRVVDGALRFGAERAVRVAAPNPPGD